jgi:hypothetical protein
MRNMQNMIIAILVAITLCASICVRLLQANSLQTEHNSQISSNTNNLALVELHGEYLQALLVAFNDFNTSIRQKYSDRSTIVIEHLSNPYNYTTRIEKVNTPCMFKISFFPEPLRGGGFKDGGTTYEIDCTNFVIIKKGNSFVEK